MWRRTFGGVLGAAMGYGAGVTAGVKLAAYLEQIEVQAPVSSMVLSLYVLGPCLALLGALVGYARGRRADLGKAMLRKR